MAVSGARMVCLIVAAVLFTVAAAWNPQPASPRYNVSAAGLLFLTLAFLFPG